MEEGECHRQSAGGIPLNQYFPVCRSNTENDRKAGNSAVHRQNYQI